MGARGVVWVVAVALMAAGCDSVSRGGIPRGPDVVPGSQDAGGDAALSKLVSVLDRGGLPPTLDCSGITWRAVGLGGFGHEHRLAPVTPGVAGYSLLREHGARKGTPPRLYMRAGSRGPLARIYVRYESVP